MKTLLLLFLFYNTEKIAVADDDSLQTASILIRTYPKKFDSVVHKNLNILNRRYFKVSSGDDTPKITMKQPAKNSDYTVFPPIHLNKDAKFLSLPDSPYFPLDKNAELKTRVKKVLPDFVWKPVARAKRAAAKRNKASTKVPILKNKPKKTTISSTATRKTTVTTTEEEDKVKLKQGKVIEDLTKKPIGKHTKSPKSYTRNKAKTKAHKDGPVRAKGTVTTDTKKILKKSPPKDGSVKAKAFKSLKSEVKPKKGKRLSNKKKHSRRGRSHREEPQGAKASRRLIASRDAAVDNYPYVISIQKNGEHWCSGALLNPRLAITTANCMWKADRQSRMKIRAGSRYTDRDGQDARIQEVVKHPLWSIRGGPDYDVALFLLDRNLKFSHTCHGVDLPNRIMYPVFDDAWVTSWGAERRDGIYERPLTLQVYHARLIDRPKCNNITQRFGVSVTENFICLAQTGRRAPCTRDTGAPAVSDGVLWGLASWGIRKLCGTERFPAMFSYMASQSNMDFISQATTFLMADERHSPFKDRYPFAHLPSNISKMEQYKNEMYDPTDKPFEREVLMPSV